MHRPQEIKKRHYEAIWEAIRKDEGATLIDVADEAMDRIIKAVRKEKLLDLGFKVLNTHDRFRLYAEKFPGKGKIVFKLQGRLGIQDPIKD